MILLEIIFWWLFVPAGAIAVCCGLVSFMDNCRDQAELARLWDDDKVAADAGPAVGLADIGGDNTPAWQPSLCVGRTGQAGALTFPREWVAARARPFDQEAL